MSVDAETANRLHEEKTAVLGKVHASVFCGKTTPAAGALSGTKGSMNSADSIL